MVINNWVLLVKKTNTIFGNKQLGIISEENKHNFGDIKPLDTHAWKLESNPIPSPIQSNIWCVCALNAEFQHFILRFNKTVFTTFPIPPERGGVGERRPRR